MYWTQIIERIVNVTLTLATQNLAFRGHREESKGGNCGKFLAIIDLLSKYDPLLENLLQKPGGNNSIVVVTNIIVKIQSSPFFSIITDTTQDISKTDQLSQIIRYVTIQRDERGMPMKLEVNESFLGFRSITDQHSENLVDQILGCIENS